MRPRVSAILVSLLCGLVFAAPAEASFPGANGKIAFVRESGVGFPNQIRTVNPDGTGDAALTDGTAFEAAPAWSPDGRRIAFMSTRGDPSPADCQNCNYDIYAANADGSGLTRLTDDPGSDSEPAWSPGGTQIVWAHTAELSPFSPTHLWIMNVDGSGKRQLTFGGDPSGERRPAWSPDGTKIAYTSGGAIRKIDPDGSGDSTIEVDTGGSELMPDWSPRGDELAFTRFTSETQCVPPRCVFITYLEVWTMSADGSGAHNITPLRGFDSDPAWSPDGSKIAFDDGRGISTISPDGTGRTEVVVNAAEPDWQPVVGPQRSDYKNAAQFCKAERDFLGDAAFRQKYGGGANAHGKCVGESK